jgi:hypothetical protein
VAVDAIATLALSCVSPTIPTGQTVITADGGAGDLLEMHPHYHELPLLPVRVQVGVHLVDPDHAPSSGSNR